MANITKRVRIETLGGQAFNVPNDEEGRTFLRLMRKYLNRPLWRYLARSRGPRKRAGDAFVSFSRSLSIPQAESKWLAVYLGGSGHWGGFSSITRPNPRPLSAPYAVNSTPPWPEFTPEEQALLDTIMEEAEEKHGSDTFYSVFQKLVDI
jgi:hypothetical protein